MKANHAPTLYWSQLQLNDWNLYIAATEKGLSYVGSPGKPVEEMTAWAKRRFPASPLIHDPGKMQPYAAELLEYIRGERQSFTIPLDLRGTSFQLAVWAALCEIPYGQTRSYSEIAHHIEKPSSTRAVGAAIGANPLLISVPCHRVLGKNGTLTGYRGGLEMKTKLLQLEGSHLAIR